MTAGETDDSTTPSRFLQRTGVGDGRGKGCGLVGLSTSPRNYVATGHHRKRLDSEDGEYTCTGKPVLTKDRALNSTKLNSSSEATSCALGKQ